MSGGEALLVWLCAGGLVHALLLLGLSRWRAALPTVHVAVSGLTAVAALQALAVSLAGGRPLLRLSWAGPELTWRLEPLGALCVTLICLAGLACSIYAVGYVRALRERQPLRLQSWMALSVSAGCSMALAGGLFAQLLGFLAVGIAAAALVGHASGGRAARAGERLLLLFVCCGMGLILPALAWTSHSAGSADFLPGGLLPGQVGAGDADVLLVLFFLGLLGFGILPFGGWMRDLTLAPAPAAALLLGASVTLPLGLAFLKVCRFVFADALLQAGIGRPLVIGLCALGMAVASIAMMLQQSLRDRLAHLASAQLSLVGLGAALGGAAASLGAALQLAAASVALLALTLALGAIDAATGRDAVRQMPGLARRMPLTFLAFTAAALSAAGAPPLAGAWARLWLASGASEAGYGLVAGVVLLAGLSAFAAFGAPAVRASIDPAPTDPFTRPDGASILLSAPTAAVGLVACLFVLLLDPLTAALTAALQGGLR